MRRSKVPPPRVLGNVMPPEQLPAVVKKSKFGWGLFATRNVYPSEVVAYYGGVVKWHDELTDKQKAYAMRLGSWDVVWDSHPDTPGAFRVNGTVVLGPMMNSANKTSKRKNVRWSSYRLKGEWITRFIAIHPVSKGDEFLTSYSSGYNYTRKPYKWTPSKFKELGLDAYMEPRPDDEESSESLPPDLDMFNDRTLELLQESEAALLTDRTRNAVELALRGESPDQVLFPNEHVSKGVGFNLDDTMAFYSSSIERQRSLRSTRLMYALYQLWREKEGYSSETDYYLHPEERSVFNLYLTGELKGSPMFLQYAAPPAMDLDSPMPMDEPPPLRPPSPMDDNDSGSINTDYPDIGLLHSYKPVGKGGTVTVMSLGDKECTVECIQCVASNKTGQQCRNTTCDRLPFCWVHFKYKLGLVVGPSLIPDAGKGLFAVKEFKQGEVVLPSFFDVSGVDYRKGEFSKLWPRDQPTDGMEVRMRGEAYVVDPTCRRFIWRYVNHSEDPNCELRGVRGELELELWAIKDIQPGDELTAQYSKKTPPLGAAYYKSRQRKSKSNWDDSNPDTPYLYFWR